jgi:hypothetical protein
VSIASLSWRNRSCNNINSGVQALCRGRGRLYTNTMWTGDNIDCDWRRPNLGHHVRRVVVGSKRSFGCRTAQQTQNVQLTGLLGGGQFNREWPVAALKHAASNTALISIVIKVGQMVYSRYSVFSTTAQNLNKNTHVPIDSLPSKLNNTVAH